MKITPAQTPLPRHAFSGLQALAVLPSGRPVWPVMGGNGEGGSNDGGGGQGGGDGGGTGSGGNGSGSGAGSGTGGGERTFSQTEVDRIIGDRLAREREKYGDYEDLRAKATKLDELEDAKKSDEQKLLERIEAAEKRVTEAESRAQKSDLQLMRARVGAAKGLSPALAARLAGTTEEEITADADDLLASMASSAAAAGDGNGSGSGAGGGGGRVLDQGTRGKSGSDKPTAAAGAELYAQRHGKKT